MPQCNATSGDVRKEMDAPSRVSMTANVSLTYMSLTYKQRLSGRLADHRRAARVSQARQGDHDRLRKVHIPRERGGKSSGDRTIYVFGGVHMPMFLVTVLARNEKDN